MKQNRPIKKYTVKRSPDVRKQINEAAKARQNQFGEEVKFLQEQLNAGDEKIEKLKGEIVTTKRANNTTRVGALGATAAGTLALNLTLLQGSETLADNTLKYGIVLSACVAGILMNRHFNKTDVKMTEMLKRANAWSRQEFTPEEVQTFKELYDEVKNDFSENPELKKDVKSNFVHQTSQGVIFALAIACFTSAADKLGYSFVDMVWQRQEEGGIELPLDPNDPMLKTGTKLKFPKFD